jgi:hypothetical protein
VTRPHPATLALGGFGVGALLALWWAVAAMQEAQSRLQWSGESPPPDVVQAWALFNFGYALALPSLGLAVAASAIGLVLVWCLPRLRRTGPSRRVSAARGR